MLFSAAGLVLLAPLVARAQYGYGPPAGGGNTAPTTTQAAVAPSAPSDTPGHHNVNVAPNEQFVFTPNSITASVGDQVTFWFPNNGLTHSVTQSSMAAPCTHLTASSNSSAGFDSGLTADTQFTITISDASQPIFFHCKQVLHCGMGMVGVINGNITQFMAAAEAIGSKEATETDSGFVSGGVNAVASASPSNTGMGATNTPASDSGNSGNAGSRVEMSFGAMLVAAAAIALL
uniref:Blue (type 1) copper domain-containing protein n=1 Tax=Mycena chlorophos TaxID=658473 RepID=A0ABQ0MD77_MYCCL|nr:predicted protein [Mycena chlorophos]